MFRAHTHMFSAEGHQARATLPSRVSPHYINKYPSHRLLGVKVSPFLCFSVVISLFKMAPRSHAEVLSSVPKCEEAMMCLREKVQAQLTALSSVGMRQHAHTEPGALKPSAQKTCLCVAGLAAM